MAFHPPVDFLSVFGAQLFGDPLPQIDDDDGIYELIFSPNFQGAGPVAAYQKKLPYANATSAFFSSTFESTTRCPVATVNSGQTTFNSKGVLLETNSSNNGKASVKLEIPSDDGEFPIFDAVGSINFLVEEESAGVQNSHISIGIIDYSTGDITQSSTVKGAWVTKTLIAGVEAYYFCTSDGTSVTATQISGDGPLLAGVRNLSIVFNQTPAGLQSISLYRGTNEDPVATHTTNLPTGECVNDVCFYAEVKNGASETNNQTLQCSTYNFIRYNS